MRVPFLRNERKNNFPTHKNCYFTFFVVLLLVIAFFLSVYCSAQVYAQCGMGSSPSSGSDTSSVSQSDPKSGPDPLSDIPDWVKDPFGPEPGSGSEPKPEPKPDSGPEQVPEPKPESKPEINTPSDSTSNQPGYDSDNYETDYDPNEEWMEDYIKWQEEEELRREAEERETEEYLRWLHEESPFEEDYMNFQHDPFISHGDKELPWWVPPTIELIDDATDYAPGKGLINVIRHLNNGEPLQALQELVSMPFGWAATLISHIQKLTGTELTMENVFYDTEPLYYQVPKVNLETGFVILDPVTGEPLMETITRDENLLRKRGLSDGPYHGY